MNQNNLSMEAIKIGPIRKAKQESNTVRDIIRKRANEMKVGEAFDISGIRDERQLMNIRAHISYFGQRDGFRVKTSFKNGVLSIEKVRKNIIA
jgi:hypothetical protein